MSWFGTPLENYKKRTGKALSTFSAVEQDLEMLATDITSEQEKGKKEVVELEKKRDAKVKDIVELGEEKKNALNVAGNIRKILGSSLAVEPKKGDGKGKK